MEAKSEKEIVEAYIKQFALEECLDEIVNVVIEQRPSNPYMAIAQALETKTLAEILDVQLVPILVSHGYCGIQATITTNIGPFIGSAAFPYPIGEPDPAVDMLRDFTGLGDILRDVLAKMDPRDMSKIDDTLQEIQDCNTTASLAVSIACARAGARHKGLPLYKFLAESMTGTAGMKIPMPVITVLSRAAGAVTARPQISQEITVIPTRLTSLDNVIESAMRVAEFIKRKIDTTRQLVTTSDIGCPRIVVDKVQDAVNFVCTAIKDSESEGYLMPGIDMQANSLSHHIGADKIHAGYYLDGPDLPIMQGDELADNLWGIWKEYECVSVEDPLDQEDIKSLRLLKVKISQTITDIKSVNSEDMDYAMKGVGTEEGCALQIIADQSCTSSEDISRLDGEKIFNAVKVSLVKFGSITEAFQVCKAANQFNWKIVVGTEDKCPETMETFITDFAVAVGACQFNVGGIGSGEHSCKLNRLLEISREDFGINFVGRKFRI